MIIADFGCTDCSTVLHEGNVLGVACVGNSGPPLKREKAHLLLWLETIVSTQIIGERGRDVLGSFIQSLVAFPGVAGLTCFSILSGFGPEGFVGSTDVQVGFTLQPHLIARLTVCKSIAAYRVQSVSVCQLRSTQGFELIGRGMQFELGSEHLFHSGMVAHVHIAIKPWKM